MKLGMSTYCLDSEIENGRMTLREILSERQIETERFAEWDEALRRIPNI